MTPEEIRNAAFESHMKLGLSPRQALIEAQKDDAAIGAFLTPLTKQVAVPPEPPPVK